jgi:flagellar protein FliO/FliZ
MSTALFAAFALASLPAANPLSLPEGTAPAPLLPALSPPAALPLSSPSLLAPASSSPVTPPSVSALSSGSPSPLGLAGGALIILSLGAATLWTRKRKRQGTRHIQVVETASLGPKRSLALVVVGRQSLLLSCCDSGIFLVSAQPATPELLQETNPTAASAAEARTPLFHSVETPRAPGGFAAQLAEAEETQGLRRRLSEAGVLR